MKVKRIALAATLAAGLVATAITPAHAADRGVIVAAPDPAVSVKSFPRIPASKPDAPVTAFAQVRAPGCRDFNGSYCDAIELKFAIPEGYRDIYSVRISLDYEPGTTNNSMQLWVWPDGENATSGAPFPGCGSKAGESADTKAPRPKNCTLGEPADAVWITVVNVSGINNGYTIKTQWIKHDIDVSQFTRSSKPSIATSSGTSSASKSGSSVSPSFDGTSGSAATTGLDPKSTPRKVLRPGEDGQLKELTLPVLDNGVRSARNNSNHFDPVTAMVVGILLLAGSVVGFIAIRRRRSIA